MEDAPARLERLGRGCADRAWRLAVALLRDRDEAEDAVQQAFVVAARKATRIPANDPWPWFAAVLVGEVRNMRRKRRPQTGLESQPGLLDPDAPDPARAAEQAEQQAALWAAIGTLPEREREALLLTHFSGLSHAAAGDALGRPPQTVSSQVSRARERLAGRLKPELVAGAALGTTLAGLQVVAPAVGLERSRELWLAAGRAALEGAVETTSVGGAAALALGGGGAAVKISTTTLVASSLVTLGLGFAGGLSVAPREPARPSAIEEASLDTAGLDPAQPPSGLGADRRPLPSPPLAGDGEEVSAAAEERLAGASTGSPAAAPPAELAALRAEVARLEEELAPYRERQQARRPTFTFGAAGQLEAVQNTDWRVMGGAAREVAQGLQELRRLQAAGEKPPQELLLSLQRNTERMRRYEYEALGKLPSDAHQNGETTHPITLANMVAAALRDAGLELDSVQVRAVSRLGERFEQQDAARRQAIPAGTPRVVRMHSEYLLKERFHGELWTQLSSAQQQALTAPEHLGVAYADLFHPILMVIHSAPLLVGEGEQQIVDKLRQAVIEQHQVAETELSLLEPLLADWLRTVRPSLTPAEQSALKLYGAAEARVALAANAALVRGLLQVWPGDDPRAEKLRESPVVFVPRLVRPSPESEGS